jgi:hypothetical protein
MSAPPTTDAAVIKGYDLSALTPVQGGLSVEQWQEGTAAFTAIRISVKYACVDVPTAMTLAYPWWSAYTGDGAPTYDTCYLRRIATSEGDAGEAYVTLIYENLQAMSYVTIDGVTVIELEEGSSQRAIELHPRFWSLTSDDFSNVRVALSDGIRFEVVDSSKTRVYFDKSTALPHATGSSGDFQYLDFTGAAYGANYTGTSGIGSVNELLTCKIAGIVSYDVNTVFCTIRLGYAYLVGNLFADDIYRGNKLMHPGYGLPGGSINWRVCGVRDQVRGPVRERCLTYEYNADGWDPRFYILS